MEISLKAARINAKMTQTDVCIQLGIRRGTLSRWENGKAWPNVKQMQKLCELYGVNTEDLKL